MKAKETVGFKPEEKFNQLLDDLSVELDIKKAAIAEQAAMIGVYAAALQIVEKRSKHMGSAPKKSFLKKIAEMVRGAGIEPATPTVSRLMECFS